MGGPAPFIERRPGNLCKLGLVQAFGEQGLFDGGAIADAGCKVKQMGQAGQIDTRQPAPAVHGEQVGVCHGERGPHQVRLARELFVDPSETVEEFGARLRFGVFGSAGVEQGGEAFVQFGADEVEPLLEFVALPGAIGRGQVFVGGLVSDVLNDGRALGQELAVVELEQGDIAVGADGSVICAVAEGVLAQVHRHGLKRQTCFAKCDVGRQGARAGAVVELHLKSPEGLG